MDIALDFTKSLEVNASSYFELAKKFRGKAERAGRALELLKQRALVQNPRKKQFWYSKFHWFFSSKDVLCVGGRNAASNDVLVQKHVLPDETVLHTEMAGSPFFVIKGVADEETISECAVATAVFSRAWKLGFASADVIVIKGSQLKKKGPKGESLAKGSFFVEGRHDLIRASLECAVGVFENVVVCAPLSSVSKKTKQFVVLHSGSLPKEDAAKSIASKLSVSVQDVIEVLPSGGFAL
ncbi:DUF814 domain-containing protein [Candidatus Woesearchaeota archaeon]|nr:DUF814 domain-containing protein [Candidatus Woesearchaeota archaeon]